MRLSPRDKEIGRRIFKYRRGAANRFTPASLIKYTHGAALPSMIGTSG